MIRPFALLHSTSKRVFASSSASPFFSRYAFSASSSSPSAWRSVSSSEGYNYQILGSEKIGKLTLRNVKKRNALSISLLQDLRAQFESIASTPFDSPDYTKVVILNSEGPVFSAGHDLKEMKALQDSQTCSKDLFQRSADLVGFMQQTLPQITIASVHNFATAAGCQLVCSCDLILASKKASFSTPGIKIGLFCSTPGVALARSMSNQKKAFELLVTGDAINAEEAYRNGMINYLIEKEEELENETISLAKRITVHSGETLSLGKKAFYQQTAASTTADAYRLAVSAMAKNLTNEDCVEGLTSFAEKRHPHFKK